jgi:hypothetical protein
LRHWQHINPPVLRLQSGHPSIIASITTRRLRDKLETKNGFVIDEQCDATEFSVSSFFISISLSRTG